MVRRILLDLEGDVLEDHRVEQAVVQSVAEEVLIEQEEEERLGSFHSVVRSRRVWQEFEEAWHQTLAARRLGWWRG